VIICAVLAVVFLVWGLWLGRRPGAPRTVSLLGFTAFGTFAFFGIDAALASFGALEDEPARTSARILGTSASALGVTPRMILVFFACLAPMMLLTWKYGASPSGRR
jgi:hypothetical protein